MQQDQAPSAPVDPSPEDVREERDPRAGLDRELHRVDPSIEDELVRRDDAPAGAGDVVEAYRG